VEAKKKHKKTQLLESNEGTIHNITLKVEHETPFNTKTSDKMSFMTCFMDVYLFLPQFLTLTQFWVSSAHCPVLYR
jgi:hypothetical protein